VIQLDVIDGPNRGASFTPEAPSFIIGRGRTNRVILLDGKVSGRHAQMRLLDGKYVIRDLNSTNGTFVNGKAVTETAVEVGDEVRVGQTVLKVVALSTGPVGQAGRVSLSDEAAAAAAPVHARVSREESPPVIEQPSEDTSLPGLVEAYRNLLAMYRISSIIRSNVDVDKLLDDVLAQAFRSFRAERGAILMFDDETGELVPRVFRSRVDAPDETEMTISRTIVNQVIENQEAILTSDATLDERFGPAESIVEQHIRSAMCGPLSTKNHVLGIIYVDCPTRVGTFKRTDLELLTAIGNEAGIAVENRMLRDANIKAERLAAVGQTIAGLSHYTKNILSCMEAGSEIVRHALEEEDVERFRKGWEIVSRNERRMSELVLDMLSYSTDRQPAKRACSLSELAEEAADMVRPAADAAGVALDVELTDDLPSVQVDPRGVQRCLLNLLTNALDAAQEAENPRITVSTAREGDYAVIRVRNTGPSIPEEVKPKIFDVFFSTKGEKGTGLGLAVVRKIVTEHAGEVFVDTPPEGGAEFRVVLPMNPTPVPGESTE
jgi:signal transduction histidine kinase